MRESWCDSAQQPPNWDRLVPLLILCVSHIVNGSHNHLVQRGSSSTTLLLSEQKLSQYLSDCVASSRLISEGAREFVWQPASRVYLDPHSISLIETQTLCGSLS